MKELIDEMSYDLAECHVDYLDDAKLYTDYDTMAQKMVSRGYRRQSEWISVEERLPDREGTYLVCTFKGERKFGVYGRYCVCDEPQFEYDVTHWMPLPEPPEMKGVAE